MKLFQDLPSELRRECLLRVPYTSHNSLAAVCRSWKAVVKSPEFYEDRRKLGVSQQLICLMELRNYRYKDRPRFVQEFVITVHDPVQGTWEELPPLPDLLGHFGFPVLHSPLFTFVHDPLQRTWEQFPRLPHFLYHCVCVNRKLFLIGGLSSSSSYAKRLSTIFIYDFSSAKWSRGTDCPLQAVHAACSVSPEGLLYVAGGNGVRGAAVYNVEKDEWKRLPDMNQQWRLCFGAFIDGKLFVINYDRDPWVNISKANGEVYDPEKEAWTSLQDLSNLWNGEHPQSLPLALKCSGGSLYWFQTQQGVKVYDSRENVWRSMASLPPTLRTINCCAAWRDGILVGGNVEEKTLNNAFCPLRDHVFCMMRPQPIRPGAAVSQDEMVGEWSAVPIRRPEDPDIDYDQLIWSAVTVEI